MTYTFREMVVPDRILESIHNYIERGVPTGDFLKAVIDNDLIESVHRADENNLPILPAIVAYLHWEAPWQCHGFAGAHDKWVKQAKKAAVQLENEQ